MSDGYVLLHGNFSSYPLTQFVGTVVKPMASHLYYISATFACRCRPISTTLPPKLSFTVITGGSRKTNTGLTTAAGVVGSMVTNVIRTGVQGLGEVHRATVCGLLGIVASLSALMVLTKGRVSSDVAIMIIIT